MDRDKWNTTVNPGTTLPTLINDLEWDLFQSQRLRAAYRQPRDDGAYTNRELAIAMDHRITQLRVALSALYAWYVAE